VKGKRGKGFFFALSISHWFTTTIAWVEITIWEGIASRVIFSSLPTNDKVFVAVTGFGYMLFLLAVFALFFWGVYHISSQFREVFDGLFGLRERDGVKQSPTF